MTDLVLSAGAIDEWRVRAFSCNSITRLLRDMGETYNLDRFQLTSLMADVFEERLSGEDRQVIWKWKHDRAEGFEDEEVDQLLSHLLNENG